MIAHLTLSQIKRAILIGTISVALLCYAFWIEPDWIDINIYDVGAKNSEKPVRIVQLSDLHLQSIGRHELKIVQAVHAIKPDLIVISGDAIDQSDALPVLEKFLGSLDAIPLIAVLGNWEYWSEVDRTSLRVLYERRTDTKLLVNEEASFHFGSRTIRVFGLDDFTASRPRLDSFTHDSSVTTLAVQHSPGWFDSLEAKQWPGEFDLCLSGHTHGGQITLFGLPLWTPRGSGDFTSGFYKRKACLLYVSRGLGTSVLPIRFGSRPEIAVFDL